MASPRPGEPQALRTLTREEARRTYDRIGRLQDSQAFYEDRAVDLLVHHGHFGAARRIFEFGCGTGRLALRLLTHELPDDATYEAVDLSPVMVRLARERLLRHARRAHVRQSDGGPPRSAPAAAYDRFVSTYVLDLLSEEDIAGVLAEAHRMLEPGGLLCVSSLSTGAGPGSRAVAGVWSALHRLHPAWVGGCRPLDLAERVASGPWKILHRERVAPFAVPSEVVVAARAGRGAADRPPPTGSGSDSLGADPGRRGGGGVREATRPAVPTSSRCPGASRPETGEEWWLPWRTRDSTKTSPISPTRPATCTGPSSP